MWTGGAGPAVTLQPEQYIRWVQLSLRRLLGVTLKADGADSPDYRKAVKQFQQEKKLTLDGKVGRQTQNALIKANAEDTNYVEWVQRALNEVGAGALKVSGAFDRATRDAVRSFQSYNGGLEGDGWVGPKTELALIQRSQLLPPDRPGGYPPQRPPPSDPRYELALRRRDWSAAAKVLNDFTDADILALLKQLSATELAYMARGAILSKPRLCQRVLEAISRLNASASAVGARLATAQKNLEALGAGFKVDIVSRRQWGARPPKKDPQWYEYPKSAPLPLKRIVVHHTADPLGQTVKELQDKMMRNGYSDLAYHFVITSDGTIHEGRTMNAVGAHAGAFKGNKDITKDPDYGAIGVVVTGDFESRVENRWSPDAPTPAQRRSLEMLLKHLVWKYQLAPSMILRHSEVKRDGAPTECPGAKLSPDVDASKRAARRALTELAAAEEVLRSIENEALRLK
jgi:N-acetyl-anhydromuramyl-L-alanine amidase AmpD